MILNFLISLIAAIITGVLGYKFGKDRSNYLLVLIILVFVVNAYIQLAVISNT